MTPPWDELHRAFVRGDIKALRKLLADSMPEFPNGSGPSLAVGRIVLQYAIYHSPPALIEDLLRLGADPNYADKTGFRALIAALANNRAERHEILTLLLRHGADPNQRGVNDFTALHFAAGKNDVRAMEILIRHGADAQARTRAEDGETVLDVARRAEARKAIALLTGLRSAAPASGPAAAPLGKFSSSD